MRGFSNAKISERPARFADWASLRYLLYWAYEGGVLERARNGTYADWATSCWLVKKGRVVVETSGRKTSAGPGQWIFVASPSRHQSFSRDAEILSLHFDLVWPDGGQVISRESTRVLRAADFPDLEKAARPIVRHVKRAFPRADAFLPSQPSSLAAFLKVQSLLPVWIGVYLEVLSRLGIHPRRLEIADDRLLLGAAILDKHPLAEPFRESALLEQVGLNRSRFDALFSAAFGVTPRRYIERRRLRAARDLLLHTPSSIKEIAFGLGFRHPSHFSLWFRRLEGASASEFRKKR